MSVIPPLRRVLSSLRKFFPRAARSYTAYHTFAEYKLRYAAMIGVVSFPAFYVIWTVFAPQPYENLLLRSLGTALCLGVALSRNCSLLGKYHKEILSYITIVFCLPFFFTFMMLMNGANPAWLLSALAALIYVVFLMDELNIAPALISGAALGVALYLGVATEPVFHRELYAGLPILVYTLVGVCLLNYSNNAVVDEKLKAAKTLAGYIAHEMRTPLASIRLDAKTAQEIAGPLTQAYEFAVANGYQGQQIRAERIKQFGAMHDRVIWQVDSANSVIDALLLNIRGAPAHDARNGLFSMQNTVERVIATYVFKGEQSKRLHFVATGDFNYRGADQLMRHVVFNLLRNALRATEANGGKVTISLVPGEAWNVLLIADEGAGIERGHQRDIFIPFTSHNRDSGGSGLGLAFCRMVVEAMDGDISFQSEPGQGTVFTVRLPRAKVS